jgi:energy-coupling factor transport system permease protein
VWPGERAADEIAARLAPLERIGLPVHRARATVGLALRFAPLLAEEGGRIARLQALRAGGPARGWVEGVRRRRASLVPLVVAALERAEQVALALEARHYRVRPLPARTPAPWLASGSALALFAAALLWRR